LSLTEYIESLKKYSACRAGFLPEEWREIEDKLASGELLYYWLCRWVDMAVIMI
jgi:hypothetical protein